MSDLIDRKAAIEAMYDFMVCGSFAFLQCGGELEEKLKNVPSVPAVPLDKLCELYEEINAKVPCILCKKIMFEWCKQNNNLPLTWDEEWKCPTQKQLLTKWMEGLDAAD